MLDEMDKLFHLPPLPGRILVGPGLEVLDREHNPTLSADNYLAVPFDLSRVLVQSAPAQRARHIPGPRCATAWM